VERASPLNLIQLGNEWLGTNGELAPDGSIHFPEEDPAEEVFGENGTSSANIPPDKPPHPPSVS
jgi:hypothetical protein